MIFKIKVRVASTAGDRVQRAQVARMVFKIKEKLKLTAEDHVLRAKV